MTGQKLRITNFLLCFFFTGAEKVVKNTTFRHVYTNLCVFFLADVFFISFVDLFSWSSFPQLPGRRT